MHVIPTYVTESQKVMIYQLWNIYIWNKTFEFKKEYYALMKCLIHFIQCSIIPIITSTQYTYEWKDTLHKTYKAYIYSYRVQAIGHLAARNCHSDMHVLLRDVRDYKMQNKE